MPNSLSFRYFKTSPEIIQLAVMLYVRFPLSLRNLEDLLHERGVDVSYESVRYWWQDLVLSSQARSRSAGQGEYSPVIGNGTSDREQMLKLVSLVAPIILLSSILLMPHL
jgi:hypothetical protein